MSNKSSICRVYSSPHLHGEDNESQFSPTFSSPFNRQHPSHLVLNNFISSSDGTKSVSTVVHHHEETGDGDKRNTHPNFLYVYFFFSYYLLLTPFRLKKVETSAQSSQSSNFVIQEYLPQKIVCGIANLFVLLRYGVEFRRCVEDVKRDNPISFFKLFEACSSLVFKTVILQCFWRKKKRFLEVVHFLENSYILPYNRFKIESVPVISSLCGLYVIIGFIRMIAGDGFLRPSHLTPSWWGRRLVAEARYAFFLANETNIDYAPEPDEISSLDIFLAIITGCTFHCRFIAGYFVDVGILLCVLSLWAPVTGFAVNIRSQLKARGRMDNQFSNNETKQSSPPTSQPPPLSHQADHLREELNRQETVMTQYKALKRLTELISQSCGATILPFISEAVFGYAIFFEDVLITTNVIHRIVLICFYFCAVNILIFSADVCRKMQCMKTWLWDEERFSTFPNQKLMLILHDLSTNAVGITASGIFTVDFYLVGSTSVSNYGHLILLFQDFAFQNVFTHQAQAQVGITCMTRKRDYN